MDEDVIGRIVLGLVMVASGVLVIRVAHSTASGRLGRNQVAGIRTASTLASDAAWLAAHQRAKRSTLAAGACAIASAVPTVLPVPIGAVLATVLAGCLAMLGFAIHGTVVGGRAAREAQQSEHGRRPERDRGH
ncbi:SdpI family protein [Clavibacter sp. MX14-G9D]|uniref:SdpI family protein n=1 Tax=Clavibacter sp. MX14-G9D TaxID=3064656 RepID=UPI00293F620B|nr:SdpI family protein [Clavibacter sp. MX14-G9D]